MTLSILAVLLAFPQPFPANAESRQQRVAVVVDRADEAKRPVLEKISRAIQARAVLSVYDLEKLEAADPIEKGKLLAQLQTRDLIVAVGDGATEFVTRELEDTPVYFVGAGLIGGDRLASHSVTGMFSYNVESLLDAVKSLWPGAIGLAYTPGYEPVAAWVRQGAAHRGMVLSERRIASLKEFTPAMRALLGHSRTIWVVGDPLLVRGAGFEFLRETALSRGTPIIAAGLWEVQHGAFLAFAPKGESLASSAAEAIDSVLRGELDAQARLRPAPPNGVLLLNGPLADKGKITVPAGPPWQMVR